MIEPFRPNQARARTAIILIWVFLGAEVVNYLSAFVKLRALDDRYSDEFLRVLSISMESVAAFAILGATIACAITFIQWFRRAYFNLHLIDNGLRFGEGWAAGAWFIPFLNLVRPVQIMFEMYNVARVEIRRSRPEAPVQESNTYVSLWWAVWIIGSIWANLNTRLSMYDDSLSMTLFTTKMELWQALVDIPAAILAVKVIRDYSAMEGQLEEIVNARRQGPAGNESAFKPWP